MVLQINGRDKVCKDSITGVKRVYIAPYTKLLRSQYTYNGVRLTNFPLTYFYKFDFNTQASFTQSLEIKEGNTFYNQSLSLTFNKASEYDNLNFQKLTKKDFRIILEMKNGDFLLMGFLNGVTADKLETSESRQYQISFKGIEEDLSPYVTTLIGTDLILYNNYNLLFQNGDRQIFQDNTNINI